MATATEQLTTGTAAGVPYVVRPLASGRDSAPLLVVWHLMDAPASEAAKVDAVVGEWFARHL